SAPRRVVHAPPSVPLRAADGWRGATPLRRRQHLRHGVDAAGAEAARIAAFLADAAHLRVGQVRCAVNRVDRAVALFADVVQPVARLAAAGAGRVVQRRLAAVDVQFAVVHGAADEKCAHRCLRCVGGMRPSCRRWRSLSMKPAFGFRHRRGRRWQALESWPVPAVPRASMTSTQADPALQALLLPFGDGTLAWPSNGALFLRARDGWPLHERPLPGLVCEQEFRPDADALQRSGYDVRMPDDAEYPRVLVLPPRQRDEARALFAEALARLQPGGIVVASAANDAGAK